ncbi:hypothetical protein Q1695_003963 [Nippostrongylus brasiliensis]|nr:hypothetical protein Q1695_003963 [Nippostrongylus brasiliensis]
MVPGQDGRAFEGLRSTSDAVFEKDSQQRYEPVMKIIFWIVQLVVLRVVAPAEPPPRPPMGMLCTINPNHVICQRMNQRKG